MTQENTNIATAEALTPEEQAQLRAEQETRLEAFSKTIANLRASAISARQSSGIEEQWQEDEDHYESIDNANRTTVSRTKPYDFAGTGTGAVIDGKSKENSRSTLFVPLTRPYVDIAAARISDMYMPTDDRNWDGEPTPIPDLIKQLEDQTPVIDAMGMPVIASKEPILGENQQPMVGADGQPLTQPVAVKKSDVAKQRVDKAKESWEKARTQIDDWLKECCYNAELRKSIHDLARIGTGILKGPYPVSTVSKAVKAANGMHELAIEQKISPATRRVDPWRFYPAANCGESIKDGSHVFEQDFITRSKLRDLKANGLGYIVEQINLCLEEGPMASISGTKKSGANDASDSDLFEIWYFEGQITGKDLKDANCKCDDDDEVYNCVITMVNERIIKAALSHMDSGEFSYDVAVWQRKSGLWIGDGVGRQGRTAQKGLNAAVRNLMDNAGQSSRPYKVINQSVIKPGADPWTWHWSGDADAGDVSRAMMFFNVPTMQGELMNIINYFQKMFEDSTGLPMLLQGNLGNAPDTVGGMEMLQNNAGIVPRNIVRMLDDKFTEPQIRKYYEYLLIHGEDESAKGDFNIHARGSSALMERASQDQFLLQVAQFVMNPAFDLDPILYMEELLKSKRINPARLKLTDEKKKELAGRQPPEDPRITAAKITAQGWIQREQLESKQVNDRLAADAHLEMNQQAFEASEAEKDRQMTIAIEMINTQLATAGIGSVERLALEKIKATLAGTSMKLNVTKDLAVAGHMMSNHKTPMSPVIEPVGRAPNGQSFQA